MTITEAAACGTPAVATRIAGHRDAVVDERHGPARRRPECGSAPAIERVSARRRVPRAAVRPARSTHAARFTWAATARGTLEVLADEALRRRHVSSTPGCRDRADIERRHRAAPVARAASATSLLALARVRAAAAAPRSGQGRGRHQAVPLPRSRPAARSRPVSMWDPHIGMGTVTHQNIGYLFPMGPYYWILAAARRARLGRAATVARLDPVLRRRLGVLYLLRDVRPARPGRGRRRGRLHVHAVHARLRGAHLGDPAAVGGAAVDDRGHAQGAARRGLAVSRDLRAGRAGRSAA